MLSVNDIHFFYLGKIHALWDISFDVKPKEIVTIIGSNGAGKTTMIKTVSGLLHPSSGRIEFKGQRIDTTPPHEIVEMGIIHVPEGRRIFTDMNVMENLEMGSYSRRARRRKKDSMEWVFQLFPVLKERKKQIAGTLSGGERQMLAIGRALMGVPELIMFDEPSLGLAPLLVLQTFEILQRLKEDGVTILLVEQNIHNALKLADRAYVIENGRIIIKGSSEEVINNSHVKKAYLGI